MNISIKHSGSTGLSDESFLNCTITTLNTFIHIHDIITKEMPKYDVSFLREMAMDPEDKALFDIGEILSDLDIPMNKLDASAACSYYGTGLAADKYAKAIADFSVVYNVLNVRLTNMTVPTASEFETIARHIYFGIGNMIYALSNIIYYPVDATWVLENQDEDIVYDPVITSYLNKINHTPLSFAQYLVNLQHGYLSVIPLYERDPEEWVRITKDLPVGLVDSLSGLGMYITSLDIRAFRLGYLDIDEEYVDLLRAREDNEDYIGNVDPDNWAVFLKLVPDELIPVILENEMKITFDMLITPIEEKQLTKEYVEGFMLKKINGELNYDTATKYFNS